MENEQILEKLAQIDTQIELIKKVKSRVKLAVAVLDYFSKSQEESIFIGGDLMNIEGLFQQGEFKSLITEKAKEIIEKDSRTLSAFVRGMEPCDVQAVEEEPGNEDAAEIDVDADPLPEEEPAPPKEKKKRSPSAAERIDRAKLEVMYFKQNKTLPEIIKETGWAKSSVYYMVDAMRQAKISTAKERVRR